MDYFAGKVALVTGSARGIGFATASLLASRGTKVVLSDVLDEPLDRARARIEERGGEVLAVRCDVADPEACNALVTAAVDHFGGLDILVNNAGVSIVAPFEECTPEACRRLIEINVLGAVYMTLAGLEALKQSRGHILFISSVSGIRAIPTGSLYSASKAALRSLGESLRIELKPAGVHVGVLYPGFTTSDPDKTVMKGDGSPRPIDRPPHDTPEGVARAVVRMIERRRAEMVLTPLGKATALLERLSPRLLDRLLQERELKN